MSANAVRANNRYIRARGELVEPRAKGSSFDRPVLSETLIRRQAQDERRVEGPVLSETLILRQAQDERRVEGLRTSCVLNRQRRHTVRWCFLVTVFIAPALASEALRAGGQ